MSRGLASRHPAILLTMNRITTFLFARPTFLEGMARVLDMGGTMTEFNRSPTPRIADALALRSDWMAVGQDLLGVMNIAEEEAYVQESETGEETCPTKSRVSG